MSRLRIYLSLGLCSFAFLLYSFGALPGLNFFLLVLFACALFLLRYHSGREVKNSLAMVPFFIWLGAIVLGFVIAVYRPVGFHYPLLWSTQELFPGGEAFALFVNISKALAGYLILVCLLRQEQGFISSKIQTFVLGCLAVTFVLLSANMLFGVAWKVKFPDAVLLFVLVNLCVSVLAEEAFFRCLIQDRLSHYCARLFQRSRWQGFWSGTITVLITSLLFSLVHSPTSVAAFLLFLIAGSIYSLVYALTRRLIVVVVVHFSVNLLHFLLLEYPLPSNI